MSNTTANQKKYSVYFDGLDKTVDVIAIGEAEAKNLAWESLTDAQRDAVASIEIVDAMTINTAAQVTRVATLREISTMCTSLASLLALHDIPRLQRSLQDDAAFIGKVADSIEETLWTRRQETLWTRRQEKLSIILAVCLLIEAVAVALWLL